MLKDWMKGYPKKVQRQMMLIDDLWTVSKKEKTDILVVLQAVLELLALGITDQEILKPKFHEILNREKALFTEDPNAYYVRLDAILAARG